jgi:pimeloyl-ACP methyl ester carboxylesterase
MRRIQGRYREGNLFAQDFRICDRYAQGLAAAARLQCPASLLLGERDQMTSPRQTREIAAALKAKVWTVSAGHSLMAEAPDQALHALRQILG